MISLTGYETVKMIHKGEHYILYSAISKSDQKPVLLKLIRSSNPSSNEIELLYHEYELTKDLNIPSVIKTYALLQESGRFVLVQEDIGGISLEEFLKGKPIEDLAIFFKLAKQMVLILESVQSRQIVHKDIKPANFIIDPNSLNEKLTNFQYATELTHEFQDITSPDKLEGTIAYMAPEQTGRMNMNIDYRSDFYALGATFFELLTGVLPFDSSDLLEVIHGHLAEEVPDASEMKSSIPKSLALLIKKLMEKDPSNRYQSAKGILVDLERIEMGEHEPFLLGQGDLHDRLNLSQKLYGREEDVKRIIQDYNSVLNGSVEALMLCGSSGIGKTRLIQELHKPMVSDKGYFISGKFDQLQRNTPYTAITQALNHLAKHILAEPEENFLKIKQEILAAMGDVAQIIIDIAPDLEFVLGKQPPLAELPSKETQNRMWTFFRRFLGVIASKDRPLVLFIDDLQWADSSSIKLFEYILTDSQLGYVFLIGAYRNNEVGENHILSIFFKEMNMSQREIKILPIEPLKVKDYVDFLSDSLGREKEKIEPLAELIHKRTDGNPFFLSQLVNSIYQEKYLYFDYEKGRWDWDLEAIVRLKIADNVVDLMINKILMLPEETQRLLQLASCVGNQFNIETLQKVNGLSSQQISKMLWPALKNELIITLGLGHKRLEALSNEDVSSKISKEITYLFIHDRIQQALYQMLSEEQKELNHLAIGKSIIENEPERLSDKLLFEVIDHFNHAHRLLSESEKIKIAHLNNQAGEKALKATAYQAMLNYFQAGLSLLGEKGWATHYQLTFELNRGYSKSLYLVGDVKEASALADVLIEKAQNPIDKASIYRIQSVQYITDGDSHRAFEAGVKGLDLLGFKIVRNPSKLRLLAKIAKIKYGMHQTDISIKSVKDEKINLIFEILTEFFYVSYWVTGDVHVYITLQAMELMLEYGTPPSAGLWLALYSIIILEMFKNLPEVEGLIKISQKLMKEKNDKYSISPTCNMSALFVIHLLIPYKEVLSYSLQGEKAGLESGNLIGAMSNMSNESQLVFWEGNSCSRFKTLAQKVLDYAYEINMSENIERMKCLIAIVERYLGDLPTDSSIVTFYQKVLSGKNHFYKLITTASMLSYYYLTEEYENAYSCHLKWSKQESKYRCTISGVNVKAFEALTISKVVSRVSLFEKWKLHRTFRKLFNYLKWAASACPENYLHLYLVVSATSKRLKRDYLEALKDYNRAIEQAKNGNKWLWVGIASELAGEMLIESGLSQPSNEYIQEAYYYYERYGLVPKTNALRNRYPGYLKEAFSTEDASGEENTTSSKLDFMSVIKAGQIISGEIIVHKLFEKMLYVVLENSGAEKGVFIEFRNKNWIVASSLVQSEFSILNIPLKEYEGAPKAIIQTVIRSNEILILSDVNDEAIFASDPYVKTIKPKSVLCLPINHHGQMIGLIYLENNLASGIFTDDRVKLLNVLASQIAISLENSYFLEKTAKLYQATERFVPTQFLRLLDKEHIEDVKLGDSVEKTLTILFTDIRDYTTLTEKLSPKDSFRFINDYLEVMGPIIRKHHGFINQYQGDAIMALFPGNSKDGIEAVLEMSHTLVDYNLKREKLNQLKLEVGYGLNTGVAMLGTIGEPERMDANVISDAINLASRVEGLNKFYGTSFLVSESTLSGLNNREHYTTRLVDKVIVKGKKKPIYIFEVYDHHLVNESDRTFIKTYEEAFRAYEEGKFEKALALFEDCHLQKPSEKSSQILIERCHKLKLNPIPSGWNGTFEMTHK